MNTCDGSSACKATTHIRGCAAYNGPCITQVVAIRPEQSSMSEHESSRLANARAVVDGVPCTTLAQQQEIAQLALSLRSALARATLVAELADDYTDKIAEADTTGADAAWAPLVDALNLWRACHVR